LVIAGIVIGSSVLALVNLSLPLEFMGSIGIVFLMFMAGLEVGTDILLKQKEFCNNCSHERHYTGINWFGYCFVFRDDLLAA